MEEINLLIRKYSRKGILIDTNILLLLFVGLTNRSRIRSFSRTEKFISEDFDTLSRLIDRFSLVVVTPNILTEVSSFINQLGEPERSQCLAIFSRVVVNEKFGEQYLASPEIVSQTAFVKLGLTDCGIIEVARDQYLVLTEDFRLAGYLQKSGIDTINFNHIRPLNW
jgi:rRNA-processing protein FCF1